MFWRAGDDLYPDYLNHGNAMSFIEHVAKRYCVGRGVDVGADQWPWPGAKQIRNKPNCNAYRFCSVNDGSLDYVFSSHCLEHLDRPMDALRYWARTLRPGGCVFLYLPHPAMRLWNPGGAWCGDGHKWTPTPERVRGMLAQCGLSVVAGTSCTDAYWSFHTVAVRPSGAAAGMPSPEPGA